ncbi:hypothetical protein BDW74DRAFT_181057 [Aspergillus multicolor]|uniref:uncharacterized protein n=1 Tax=Aspergillus multicolor TaxID=41759 RepID=UPI003CCDB0CA
MKITCQGFTFRTNRFVVCTQSLFFNAAINGGFKARVDPLLIRQLVTDQPKKGLTQTVDLPDDDLETIERVLPLLYFNSYDYKSHVMDLSSHIKTPEVKQKGKIAKKSKAKGAQEGGETQYRVIPTHMKVYLAADKFGIDFLKEFAAKKFASLFEYMTIRAGFQKLLQDPMEAAPPLSSEIQGAFADTSHLQSFLGSLKTTRYGMTEKEEQFCHIVNSALSMQGRNRCGCTPFCIHMGSGDFEAERYTCADCEEEYDIKDKEDGTTVPIDLWQEDPRTVARTIEFLYNEDYAEENFELEMGDDYGGLSNDFERTVENIDADEGEVCSTAYNNINVYILADTCGIRLLKELAAKRIVRWWEMNWRSRKFLDVFRILEKSLLGMILIL